MNPAWRQLDAQVRFDWGLAGATAVAAGATYAVVVDVLSFTTAVSVAVERGMGVIPHRWADGSAAAVAAAHDAVLAVGRDEARGTDLPSLSPAQLARIPPTRRVVLPSPNGAAISVALADAGVTLVAVCLRNASAVAAWLAPQLAAGASVAVVAAGERWPDGSLRPAVEDLWGAGAVVSGLAGAGVTDFSVEAVVAASAYDAVAARVHDLLPVTASGRELVDRDFGADVALAAQRDTSRVVPVLTEEGFRPLVS